MVITDVKFKPELQMTLQQTTEFKSKIKEQNKRQKNEMDKIQFQKDRSLQELERANQRIIQDLQAQRTRTEIDREKQVVNAESRADVNILGAKQNAGVAETKAKSEKEVAQAQGFKKKEEMLADIKALDSANRIKVVQECESLIYESEQKMEAAKSLAEALKAEAAAEALAADSLKVKREHELRMAKLEVLQAMAQHNKIVIGGSQGDKLINELLDKSILGDIKIH